MDERAYVARARELWQDDDIDIDADPVVSVVDDAENGGVGGAWVAAWVWVADEDVTP